MIDVLNSLKMLWGVWKWLNRRITMTIAIEKFTKDENDFSCWISLWLINVWYSESSLIMEWKWSLDWSEDPFNWLESVTWMKLNLVESYWIFDDTFCNLLKNRSLFTNHTLSTKSNSLLIFSSKNSIHAVPHYLHMTSFS